jgi:hypothetical protein
VSIWYPSPEVGEKELIGRRLLDRVGKHRATTEEGRPLYDVGDFYEARLEDDLSVDRLGDPNAAVDTLRAITGLADQEAARPESNRIFNGWATIRVQNVRFTGGVAQVNSSPTRREDGTVENHWHADINRDGFREKALAYTLAAALHHTFTRKGGYQRPERSYAAGHRASFKRRDGAARQPADPPAN